MILNFNINPRCGKTYYQCNSEWKYVKSRIKNLLDEKQSSREYKIDMIISILEHYKETYLRNKG